MGVSENSNEKVMFFGAFNSRFSIKCGSKRNRVKSIMGRIGMYLISVTLIFEFL